MAPPGVMRPILLPSASVNQRAPSGPAVIPTGELLAGIANSVRAPVGVMRPILLPPSPVNQRGPSGPAVILTGRALAGGRGGSVRWLGGVMRRSLLPST